MGVESLFFFAQFSYLSSLLTLHNYFDLVAAISEEVPECPKNMSDILRAEGVVPDVIDNFPKYHIQIEFSRLRFVNFGKMLTPEDVYWRTFGIQWHCYKEQFFSFLLVGPDEPSRDSPTDREFLYWLCVNIPIDAVICGDCLAEYVPPNPLKDTGVHRYVYVVFHQIQGQMKFDEPYLTNTSITERKHWSTKTFMKKYGFKEAYAVNFFKSEWVDATITTKSPWDVNIFRKGRRSIKQETRKVTEII